MENELDKLRRMLTKAGIPYHSVERRYEEIGLNPPQRRDEADDYYQNIVAYGLHYDPEIGLNVYTVVAVLHYGSKDRHIGMMELFIERDGEPLENCTMNALQAFDVINEDYKEKGGIVDG